MAPVDRRLYPFVVVTYQLTPPSILILDLGLYATLFGKPEIEH